MRPDLRPDDSRSRDSRSRDAVQSAGRSPTRPPRHALLLQGPVGLFFRRFGDELRRAGARVTKVNFNPGDRLFYWGREAVAFRRPLAEWPDFLRELIVERGIDAIFLFGDCRPIHRDAVALAGELDIPVWVFEEGYLRPDHVTMELGGVNGNSSMPKDPEVYRRVAATLPALDHPPRPVGNVFPRWAFFAIVNSLAVTLGGWRYPHYVHHRNIHSLRQAAVWIRGGFRKLWFSAKERGRLEELVADGAAPYFFVPLQVHCDAQLQHSDYPAIEAFIDEVVETFAEHAPPDCLLVLKHHPHDRAYREYTRYLRDLGRRLGCGERIVYVHDLHLPTLLKHARGVVTMNSTVGLSALFHRAPVKVLGRAIYDIAGLTSQKPLGDFFRGPDAMDEGLYHAFCKWLRYTNQINGSFYRDSEEIDVARGCLEFTPHDSSAVIADRDADRAMIAGERGQEVRVSGS